MAVLQLCLTLAPRRLLRLQFEAPRSAAGRLTSAQRSPLKAAPGTTGRAGTTRTGRGSEAARASCCGERCAPCAARPKPLLLTRQGVPQAEACDQLGGFLVLQSVAGGTGAGLGAYLVEALRCVRFTLSRRIAQRLTHRRRDEYPAACVLSQCVWPYESGEVIVQNYNTLLTLATLLDAADGIIIAQNEALHTAAHKLLNIARHAALPMQLTAHR